MAENRFKKLGDYTLVDRNTGLEWQLRPSKEPMVWKEGFGYVEQLNKANYGGHSDWRYPTQQEMVTLINEDEDRTTGLYQDKILGNQTSFWTSTEGDHHSHKAVYADFYYGDTYLIEENYATHYIRAVRTAQQ